MARVIKSRSAAQKIVVRSNQPGGELTLTGKGRDVVLVIEVVDRMSSPPRAHARSFSGAATLRHLAKAILKEVGHG